MIKNRTAIMFVVLASLYFVAQLASFLVGHQNEIKRPPLEDNAASDKDTKKQKQSNHFVSKRNNLLKTCKIYQKYDKQESSKPSYLSTDSRFNQEVKLKSFLIDKERKLMYCWNRKVASSFWTWMFSKSSKEKKSVPYSKPYRISSILSPKTISAYQSAVSSYQNIILVRNPLVRLVSAYRDRVAGMKSSLMFYKTIGRALHITRKDRMMQFSIHKHLPGSNKTMAITYWKKIFVPTWPEFIQFLLTTNTSQDVRNTYPLFKH